MGLMHGSLSLSLLSRRPDRMTAGHLKEIALCTVPRSSDYTGQAPLVCEFFVNRISVLFQN